MILLRWGATPWDHMSRDELLRHVQRLYSAAHSAEAVLNVLQPNMLNGYWSPMGAGGKAREKLRQALSAAIGRHCRDSLWRSFLRYADDLLFSAPVGLGWVVCEHDHLTCNAEMGHVHCPACVLERRKHVDIRPLRWDDLEVG